jgi:hypothetical protein
VNVLGIVGGFLHEGDVSGDRLGSGPFYCLAKLAKLAECFGCVILCGHSQR